ncbi:MAG: CBS domain-containing protein [gamma proteobacterium endosymbiont of Lamellibrachia anaximandri]|nr:CBS domain-containing protein [gamma proteobacterium endosymbiont of Lamellibrachia anaximandri]MBL3535244.1 CBS domain-containing protein [gamma proteobacterium endosymbiont of Lamellibrachia anaximandri]MBL3601353.1 CBS domain-containing protein [gamma proteobacterium endosymbiont of Lamellibrachia anaximandri]
MLVKDCIIETGVIRSGMLVREVFSECGRTHVQALPCVNEKGKITGRLTLKNIMKFSCLPEYMVELAPLLGGFLSCVDNAEEKINQVLCSQVDSYVRKAGIFTSSDAPAIKALAMMEKSDTSYLFVVDEGEYRGIITIQGIAARMSEIVVCAVDRGG